MRLQTVLLLGCLGSFSAVGQQAVKPAASLAPDSMTPEKLLAFALAHNGTGEIPGEGWHIRAIFDVLTSKVGTQYATGTYEETWYAPQNYRRTYTYKGVTHTDYGTPDGVFRQGDQAWPTPEEMHVRTLLVTPIPSDPLPATTTLRLQHIHFGNPNEPCTSDTRLPGACVIKKEPDLWPCLFELQSMPPGLDKKAEQSFIDHSGRMCFDPRAPILRFLAHVGLPDAVVFSKITNLHGHLIAQEIIEGQFGQSLLKIHVQEVSTLPPPDAPFQPPADAVRLTSPVTVAWDTMTENRLPDPAEPQYPAGALQEHTEGDVDIALIIAPDGSVTSAKVVDGIPLLRDAALDFVRASKFKSFLLSGTPVEVHTTARISFTAEMARRQVSQRQ